MYSIRILRRAIKDIADLPKEYARLVAERIDRLRENPRPPGAKNCAGRQITVYGWECIAFSMT